MAASLLSLMLGAGVVVALAGAGAERTPAAGALQAVGDSLLGRGDHARADSVLRDVVTRCRATTPVDSVALATALVSRARACKNLDALDEAESAIREAVALRHARLGGAHPDLADALFEQAMVLDRRQKDPHGEEIANVLAECLAVRRRAYGDDHRVVLQTRVAIALRDPTPRGNEIGLKEQRLRACLADQRRALPSDDLDLVETLFWLSEVLKTQGEGEEALEMAREALAIQRRHAPDHPDVGYCLNQLATIHTSLGQYAEATAAFEESVARQQRALGADAVEAMLAQANLASAYANQGNTARAESLLLAIQDRALREERSGKDVTRVLGSIQYKRSSVAERASRFVDAESLLLRGVQSEGMRRVPETNIEHQRLRTRLGRARAAQGDLAGAESYLDEAVRLFELARAAVGSGIAPATFDETPYETRALVRLERGQFEAAWSDIEASRGRLLGEVLLGRPYAPCSLARVQASLSGDEAIVGWVDHQLHHGGGRSWAYVIRDSGGVHWERLPRDAAVSNTDVDRRHAAFRDRIVAPGLAALGAEESDFPQDEARRLWGERFAPIERHLRGVRRIVLVPSAAMGGLPLAALTDERGRKVVERWSIRYVPSATVETWLAEHRTVARPRTGLFVGDPPMRQGTLAATMPRRGIDPSIVRGALRGERTALGSLPRLPWTRAEVQSIATLFPAPQVLVGEAATEPALSNLAVSGSLTGFDVVHLATHALMDGSRPARSALVLSQVGVSDSPPADGILTAQEIGDQWKLGAALVTLSACETAIGRNILGEGTVGFAYPLVRSGARSVLASLWSVNDESSELLMRRFYTNWLGPPGTTTPRMDKADALREAQLWVRDWRDARGRQPYRHPYYWSAFILIGG